MDKGPLERYLLELYTYHTQNESWKQAHLTSKLLHRLAEVKEDGFNDIQVPDKIRIDAAVNGFLGMPRVSRLYQLFISNPYQILTEEDIIQYVWEGDAKSQSNLSQTIKRLKRIMDNNEVMPRGEIKMVYGKGYQFIPTVSI